MKKIAVITDTSVYLEKDFINANKDLKIIQIPLIIKNQEVRYENDITDEELEKLIRSAQVTTSQIPIGVLENKWDEYLKEYDFLIFAGISKSLSAAYYTTLKLSKEEKYNKKVYVVDTEAVSIVLEKELKYILWFVQNEQIEKFSDLKKMDKEINRIKKTYKCLLFPKSLETLKRGGRITKSAALLANLLKIYPILILKHGKIDKYGIMNSYIKGIRKQLTFATENYKINEIEVIFTKFSDPNIEKEFDQMLKEFNFQVVRYVKIPNVILAHLGYDTIGFNFWMD